MIFDIFTLLSNANVFSNLFWHENQIIIVWLHTSAQVIITSLRSCQLQYIISLSYTYGIIKNTFTYPIILIQSELQNRALDIQYKNPVVTRVFSSIIIKLGSLDNNSSSIFETFPQYPLNLTQHLEHHLYNLECWNEPAYMCHLITWNIPC